MFPPKPHLCWQRNWKRKKRQPFKTFSILNKWYSYQWSLLYTTQYIANALTIRTLQKQAKLDTRYWLIQCCSGRKTVKTVDNAVCSRLLKLWQPQQQIQQQNLQVPTATNRRLPAAQLNSIKGALTVTTGPNSCQKNQWFDGKLSADTETVVKNTQHCSCFMIWKKCCFFCATF